MKRSYPGRILPCKFEILSSKLSRHIFPSVTRACLDKTCPTILLAHGYFCSEMRAYRVFDDGFYHMERFGHGYSALVLMH